MVKTEYEIITGEMTVLRDDAQSEQLQRFFKTGEGEYGHGDKFLGIKVPATRSVAKRHKTADNDTLRRLMQSEWHEIRLCALLIMVEKMKKADDGARRELTDMYLSVTDRINNWDLVDLSAPHIVGTYLLDKPRDLLYTPCRQPPAMGQPHSHGGHLCLHKAGRPRRHLCPRIALHQSSA